MRILVLCTGNSCRSQMAEAYLRHFAGDGVEVRSAGMEVHGVNPRAIAVMKEDGIDIGWHTSKHVDEYRGLAFEHVITVCDNAREHCPWFPAMAERHHRDFPDPAGMGGEEAAIMTAFRTVRDGIKAYCRELIAQIC